MCEIPEVSSGLASCPFLFLPQNSGCLTQEKIVAGCAKHFIVIADYRYVDVFIQNDFIILCISQKINPLCTIVWTTIFGIYLASHNYCWSLHVVKQGWFHHNPAVIAIIIWESSSRRDVIVLLVWVERTRRPWGSSGRKVFRWRSFPWRMCRYPEPLPGALEERLCWGWQSVKL